MQACFQTRFNHFSTPPIQLRKMEAMACSSSLQLLCAHKGLRCAPFKESTVRNTRSYGVQYSILCSRRKCASSAFHNFDPKETFSGLSYDYRWQTRDSLPRNIIHNNLSNVLPITAIFYIDGVQYSILCSRRKCASSAFHNFDPKETFSGLSYDYRWQTRDSLPRNIIVRSEIAGTGSPDAAYQISELQLVSKVRGAGFYAVTSAAALILFVLMVVGHPLVLLLDRYCRKFHHLIAKIWATLTLTPFVKIKCEGLENLPPSDSPAVYVSNHQSFLDIYTLLTLGRSFKFISKTAIFLFPVIGWAMFLMGVIPLKRMDTRSQLQALKRCTELVKNGGSVFFFPEGTRSKDGKLGAFKKGAFSIAAKVGVPVVPITLIGTGKIMPPGLETILNTGSVKVVIHPPIQGNDSTVLCNEARNIIAHELSCQR